MRRVRTRLPLGVAVLDPSGPELTDEDRRRMTHRAVGGVILFAHNYANPEQLLALTEEIESLREPALFVCVDHEGGRVQRFKEGFTTIPPMQRLGRLWDRDREGALACAQAVGYVIAAELAAHGVDFSFTPVLDLDYGASTVIGDRAFDADPACVAALAGALIHGLRLAGMAGCGKHFPGHGFVRADSHHEIPIDRRGLTKILASDGLPYAWLGWPFLDAVMPAHVLYPRVDAKQPAGFSTIWLQRILRRRLGFDGVIFSDDLSMAGAAGAGEVEQRAELALRAGCDMVLICNAHELKLRLLSMPRLRADAQSARRLARLIPAVPAPGAEALAAARKLIGRL